MRAVKMTVGGTTYRLTANDAVTDQIDSDGTIATNIDPDFNGEPYVQISIGGVGEVDHSFDFGFFPCGITATIASQICNDNNTPGITNDELFYHSVELLPIQKRELVINLR